MSAPQYEVNINLKLILRSMFCLIDLIYMTRVHKPYPENIVRLEIPLQLVTR